MSRSEPSPASTERFAARARRRRWRSARPLLVLGAVVLVLVLAGWVVLRSPLLAVDAVEVTGAQRLTTAEVRAAAGVRVGTPLARVDAAAVERRVGELPPVAEVRVSRAWPGTLRLHVTERAPIAAVVGAKAVHLVDPEGVPFATVPTAPPDLPQLTTGDHSGDDPTAEAAVEVLRSLPSELYAQVERVGAASPSAVVLTLAGGAVVEWGGVDDSARKAQVLAALLAAHPASVYDVSAPEVPTTR